MRNALIMIIAVVLLLLSKTPIAQPIKVTTKPISYAQEISFQSDILGQTTSMNIYLPSSYTAASDEHRYPVIFANGGHGSEFFHTLTGVVKHLSELDRIPESIVVSLNDSGHYPDTFTNGMWESREKISGYGDPQLYIKHLREEVFPFLQKEYRAADYKMIIGVSGSALFPLYALTHAPSLFDFHIYTTSHDMIGMGFKPGSTVIDEIQKVYGQEQQVKTALYFGVADDDIDRQDPERDKKYQLNMALLKSAVEKEQVRSLEAKVEIIENERHYDVYVKALLSAFEFQFPEKRWAKKYRELIALPGDAMQNIENHYIELSQEYGFKVLPKGDRWNSVNCLRLISRILLRNERLKESINVANRWADLRPNSSQPYERIAEIHEKFGDTALAIESLETAITIAKRSDTSRLTSLLEKRDLMMANK